MTENKRYSFYKENDYVTFFDYSEGMNYDGVVNHLNSYADEVKAYSKQNRKLIILKNNLVEDNQRLEKENEQLKKELHKIKVVNEMLSMDFANSEHELYKENEQLKFQLKECREHKLFSRRELEKENEQLKQFPIKLDNRIQKLEEDLKALKEMETDDLNPQAIEDVAIVIGMSLNALNEFKKELKGDVE